MPVITVQTLPLSPERVRMLLDSLPRAVAEAIQSPVGDVWAQHVVANAAVAGTTPLTPDSDIPIVTIRARSWRTEEQVRAGLAAAAAAVADALGLAVADVWVHWLELPPGRVFSGGEIR